MRVCIDIIDILKDLHGLFWHTFPVYPKICDETKRKQWHRITKHSLNLEYEMGCHVELFNLFQFFFCLTTRDNNVAIDCL